MSGQDLLCLAPFLVLAAAPVVIMTVISVVRNYKVVFGFSIIALIAAFASLFIVQPHVPHPIEPLFIFDNFGLFFLGILILTALLVTLLSYEYIKNEKGVREEYYIALFTSVLGAGLLAVADHFVLFFLGIETLSISLYILIAFRKSVSNSIEAGIKYLVLASVSSAFLLFGMALFYFATGTMKFSDLINQALSANHLDPVLLAGFAMMLVGVGS